MLASGRVSILQGYRGLVAFMIAISHLCDVYLRHGVEALAPIVEVGRIGGVDFFFVLSGFLIYRTYAKHVRNTDKAVDFLKRRLIRIYPLLWFFTLLSLPCYLIFSSLGEGHELQPAVIFNSLLLFPSTDKPILGAMWSLSHVVLFYLVFFAYMLRPRAIGLAIALWSALIGLHLIMGGAPGLSAPLAKFLMSTFNLEFLIGCLLAEFTKRTRVGGGAWWVLAGVALFITSWVNHGHVLGFDIRTPLYTLASCALIVGALSIESKRRVSLPPLIDMLGDASYAMIVINLPVIVACTASLAYIGLLEAIPFAITFPIVLLAVVVASVLVHLYIERPLINLFRNILDFITSLYGRVDPRKREGSL